MQSSVVSLTGNDTLVIAGINITDQADGDWFVTSNDNDLAAVKVGKNGNALFALNATGLMVSGTLRLVRGSDDDKALDAILQDQLFDFAAFQLLDANFVKRVGDGFGNVSADSGQLTGGIFARNVDSKSNAEGDTEQSVSVYRFIFANNQRAMR